MTSLNSYTPGLASSSGDTFSQKNPAFIAIPQRPAQPGFAADDIAINSLVGRVTLSGELKLSAQAAVDGSQNPIGVTNVAVTASDSNSNVDSNSEGSAHANKLTYWVDGKFNYAELNVGAGWTASLLNQTLEANGQGFSVGTIGAGTPDQSLIAD